MGNAEAVTKVRLLQLVPMRNIRFARLYRTVSDKCRRSPIKWKRRGERDDELDIPKNPFVLTFGESVNSPLHKAGSKKCIICFEVIRMACLDEAASAARVRKSVSAS